MVHLSLLWTVVLATGLFGIWWSLRHSKENAWILLLCAAAALALRVTPTSGFYGLEYEDAYVYAAASRYVTPSTSVADTSGLRVCAVGSIEDCEERETFPGHLLGYPVLLTMVQAVVPFRPELPPTVGAVLGTITALVVWWATWVISGSLWSAAIASLLFATTPVLALYGGSACSEAASSVSVAVAIGATAAARRAENAAALWRWHVLALCAVLLAVCTRRENAILIAVVPVCLLIGSALEIPRRQRLGVGLTWSATAAFVAPMLWSSLASEAGEYGGVSFGVQRLWQTLPSVFRALFAVEWFALLAVGACLAAMVSIRELWRPPGRRDAVLLVGVGVVAATMVASYASHVRSIYQLMGVAVEPFDFLRYLSNVGVPLSILTSVIVSGPMRHKRLVAGALAIYFTISASYAWTLRRDMSAAEWHSRTAPALAAVEAASELGQRYPIVTLEPLVVQTYGLPTTKVISMPFLTADHVQASGGRVLYIRQDHYQTDVDRRRYAEAFAALPTHQRVIREGAGWSVLLLDASDNAP